MSAPGNALPLEVVLPHFGVDRALLTDVLHTLALTCAVFAGRRTRSGSRVRIVGAPFLYQEPEELPGEVPIVLALDQRDVDALAPKILGELATREHVLIVGPTFDGRFVGRLVDPYGLERPLDTLVFSGPLLERFVLRGDHLELGWENDGDDLDELEDTRLLPLIGGREGRHRLSALRVGVVGCGRSGSLVVDHLLRLGWASQLVLVDDDLEERSDLRSARLGAGALGLPKVEALRREVLYLDTNADVVAITTSAESLVALEALHDCDVIFTCCDHGRGRLAASIAAKLGAASLLVDVGTHIRFDGFGSIRITADVRAIVSGDRRCLSCWGGIRRLGNERDTDWRDVRFGSHQSVNSIAVAHATYLATQIMSGSLAASTWTHFDWRPGGAIRSHNQLPWGGGDDCPVCRCAAKHPRELGLFVGGRQG